LKSKSKITENLHLNNRLEIEWRQTQEEEGEKESKKEREREKGNERGKTDGQICCDILTKGDF